MPELDDGDDDNDEHEDWDMMLLLMMMTMGHHCLWLLPSIVAHLVVVLLLLYPQLQLLWVLLHLLRLQLYSQANPTCWQQIWCPGVPSLFSKASRFEEVQDASLRLQLNFGPCAVHSPKITA